MCSKTKTHGPFGSVVIEKVLRLRPDVPKTQPELYRAYFLHAQCLRAIEEADEEEANVALQRAVKIYNDRRPNIRKTFDTLTDEDVVSLMSYDYL